MNKFTRFWDMHSGGYISVHPYEQIYIEADERKAVEVFEELFRRDPHNVTCDCCGSDYTIEEYETLEEATAFHRNAEWSNVLSKYVDGPNTLSVEEYVQQGNVFVLYQNEFPENL